MARYRNAKEELVPEPARFPHGIKALADYCHQKGLKLGIYSSAGFKTCQGFPASLDREEIDAKTWASWGIDYLKYDNCNHDGRPSIERYIKMRDALNKTGRPIYYSICNWGVDNVWEWGNNTGNSWRTTGDIEDYFDSVRYIYRQNVRLWQYGSPGGWNDPDMLEVGNGGMNKIEYKTHFTLWAMAKSPLLIGCDLRTITDETLSIIKNKHLIDINQDKLGKQAKCVINCDDNDFSGNSIAPQIAYVESSDNSFALAATNWNNKDIFKIDVNLTKIGISGEEFKALDLWNNTEFTVNSLFTIPDIHPHETKAYKITKVK